MSGGWVGWHLEQVTADVRDQLKLSAKRRNVARERLNSESFTVLDLGDPAGGYPHDLSKPRLGETQALALLGDW